MIVPGIFDFQVCEVALRVVDADSGTVDDQRSVYRRLETLQRIIASPSSTGRHTKLRPSNSYLQATPGEVLNSHTVTLIHENGVVESVPESYPVWEDVQQVRE